jgi:diadenosine tetraphosphatase ApaH/serine/threonine PP2A family protein phosphatase
MRTAILTDVHSNLEALERCLTHAREQGAERYVCLGDIVGYGADPGPVVERLLPLPGFVAVRGNHDEAAIAPSLARGPRLGPIDEALFRRADAYVPAGVREAIDWTRAQLSDAQQRFLAELPYLREEGRATYVHASCREPQAWDYVYGSMQAAQCLAAARTPVVFIGHTHLPRIFYETPGGNVKELEPHAGEPVPLSPRARYVISAGSVGQPRDGNAAACYVLHDEARDEVTFFRLAYDYAQTARKILDAGLEPFFAARLALGR